ncbi:hypothetical protein [Acinetobacter sp. 18QD2AZ41W]|uniref:hypothetical protein n=1 Tax=Acinetobacter sp. 18QD2AZ41W TaxID=2692137 RepID=UPI00135BEC16|nr:hypothetical protein [Acinetobacter sp. 18QD2AZ41W]
MKISNKLLLLCIFTLVFIKITFYYLIKNDYFSLGLGGGNDSDYYHNFAIYATSDDKAVNVWPVLLNYLNNFGLYSREIVPYFLLLLNLFFIPFLVAKLSDLSFKFNQKYYLYCLLICLIYPTLFFYTFDVYRDVFMVFSFLISCFLVKTALSQKNFLSFSFIYVLAFVFGFFLLALRPYLGYAFLLSLFLWKIKFTKKRIFFFAILYFFALFIANYIGIFERLTEYRSGFEEGEGGSTLGLDFSNPVMFIPNFILSTLGQLFGLYVTNPFAVILLLVETVPFFAMLVYLVKNIKLADSFVRFLIIFFVLYASVWLIGNDNLGTAVRLRMYNYLVVYICFFYILKVKENIKYQVVNK